MARVIRACWAYKRPRVKVLPIRDDYNTVYDYEKHQATPEFFPERLESAPKLWMVWVTKATSNKKFSRNVFKQLEEIFGLGFVPGEPKIFPNVPEWNRRLWQIKTYIDLKPITFELNKEPSFEDIPYMSIDADGRVSIANPKSTDDARRREAETKRLKEIANAIRVDNSASYNRAMNDALKSSGSLSVHNAMRRSRQKWSWSDEVHEDTVYGNEKQSHL